MAQPGQALEARHHVVEVEDVALDELIDVIRLHHDPEQARPDIPHLRLLRTTAAANLAAHVNDAVRDDLRHAADAGRDHRRRRRLGFEDDETACRTLVEQAGVAGIPLSAFYAENPERGLLRFCFAKSDAVLEEALVRLARFSGRTNESRQDFCASN